MTPIIVTLAKSEDPDEIPHNMAFHQGLDSLLRQKRSSEKEMQFFYLEIKINDPSMNIMDHSKLSHKTKRNNPLVHKGLIFRSF